MRRIILILVAFLFGGFVLNNLTASDYPDKIVFEKPVKAVIFDHKGHVEMLGGDCESCHEKLFQYQTGAAADAGDFNHKAFDQGKYCGGCHDGSNASSMDKNCTKCHIGVKGLNKLKTQKSEKK